MQPTRITQKDLLNNFSNLAKTLKQMAENGEDLIIDLHMHSSESKEKGCDLTPIETLEKLQALAALLKVHIVFSITDHESIMGSKLAILEMIKNPEKYKNITCISGVEFNASLKNVEMKNGHSTFSKVHVLGYGYDIRDPELSAYSTLNHIKFKREYSETTKKQKNLKVKYVNTGKQIIASIHKLESTYNIKLKYSMFMGLAFKKTHEEMYAEFLRIAKTYFKINHIKATPSIETTLSDIFMPDAKTYGEQAESLSKLDMFRIIELVKNAGGKIIIAHPNSITYEQKHVFGTEQDVALRKFISIVQTKSKFGLDGLEIFHASNFHGKAAGILLGMAYDKTLFPNECVITGGSDFHGDLYKDKNIGNVFSPQFNKLLNEEKDIRRSRVPNRLVYLPVIDNIVFGQTNLQTPFMVTSKVQGMLSEEKIIQTALKVGDFEKQQKKEGKTKGLEEEVISNIYKGKSKKNKQKPLGHKPKKHNNKDLYKTNYVKGEYDI